LSKCTDCTYPLVTVVIPTRNRRALLAEAIASVQQQTYPNWELIVVDDCSEDDTWSYLTSIKDSRIRVIRLERHSERSAARNRGLLVAQGEYVLFLDDDDRLLKEALAMLVDALESTPYAIAAIGQRILFDEQGRHQLERNPIRSFIAAVFDEALFGWVALQGCTLYRKAVIQECGGWNEDLAGPEDQELWLRLSLYGPAVFLAHPVLENRCHRGQWRARDASDVVDEFRRTFAEGLPLHLQKRAKRILDARAQFKVALKAYACGHYAESVRRCWVTIWMAPHLIRSPLIGRSLLGFLFRAIIGTLLGPAYTLVRKIWRALHPSGPVASPEVRNVSAKRSKEFERNGK